MSSKSRLSCCKPRWGAQLPQHKRYRHASAPAALCRWNSSVASALHHRSLCLLLTPVICNGSSVTVRLNRTRPLCCSGSPLREQLLLTACELQSMQHPATAHPPAFACCAFLAHHLTSSGVANVRSGTVGLQAHSGAASSSPYLVGEPQFSAPVVHVVNAIFTQGSVSACMLLPVRVNRCCSLIECSLRLG